MIGPYIQVTGAISKCFTFPWRISRTCTATPVAVHILMCICTRYLHFQYNYVPLTTCCVFPAKKHFCNTQKRTFFSTLNKLKYEIVLLQTSLGESYCYFNELQSCQQTIYSRGAVTRFKFFPFFQDSQHSFRQCLAAMFIFPAIFFIK